MSRTICTPRLRLSPVEAIDGSWKHPEWQAPSRPVEPLSELIAESRNPNSVSSFWRIETNGNSRAGMIGLRPASAETLRLRAIGWRSLELYFFIEPVAVELAGEAIDALADHALSDGVTFALIACVAETDFPTRELLSSLGFQQLGVIDHASRILIVFERSL